MMPTPSPALPRRPRSPGRLLAATLLLLTPLAAAAPALPKLGTVMSHLDDLYRSDSSHARMKMQVKTEFYERELTFESWSLGDQRSLVVVRAPSREAGTATLKSEEGLWSYAPRADRMVRIPSGMLSESWMGSHMTNEDLVRDTDYEEDYRSKLEWVEEGGERLLKVTMIPGPDAPIVYTRVVYILDPKGWIPRRADFYDGEEKVRAMEFSKVRRLGGRDLPSVMTIRPMDRPDEHTRIEYLEMDFGTKVDPSLFTARGLRRAARR